MKKVLSFLTLLFMAITLVACDIDQTPIDTNDPIVHTISVYDEEGSLLNNYFIENGNIFKEDKLSSFTIIFGDDFSHWSLVIGGEPFDFNNPISGSTSLYVVMDENPNPNPDPDPDPQPDPDPDPQPDPDPDPQPDPDPDPTPVGYFDEALYNGYYQGVGLNEYVGKTLEANLRTAIRRNYSPGSYNSSNWATLKLSDLHPKKPGYVWGIYDSKAIGVNNHGGQVGQWNKEHVVPQSWLKSAGLSNYGDDQHNLRAADVQENSKRGNLAFVDSTGVFGRTSGGYYPGEEHKGDVARILMYMLVIHDNKISINKMFVKNGWDTLIKWHLEDPVDDFEIKRNNIIHERQGNRNPFIDYPDLVYFVWNSQYGNLIN